ncbi:MAG: 30S ribosomal protein S3 [Phycisphaerae bacterium]|nr:30S ribosomal protein S3 [Phycisphaerae bacterium]
MGQKVNPIGFRTGITEGWAARWYAPKAAYGEFLIEDQRLRRFIDEKLNRRPPSAQIAKIEIERTRNEVAVYIHTARPGMVIGARGADIEKLQEQLEELIDRKVDIKVIEIKQPDLSAQLVAESIAEQLKKRSSFRRTMKQRCEATMAAGAKGVKIICKGRLGGAEMARSERQALGSIPLQTLQAHVDYGYAVSRTTYGTIGVRVWIYTGMYGDEVTTVESGDGGRRPARRGKR